MLKRQGYLELLYCPNGKLWKMFFNLLRILARKQRLSYQNNLLCFMLSFVKSLVTLENQNLSVKGVKVFTATMYLSVFAFKIYSSPSWVTTFCHSHFMSYLIRYSSLNTLTTFPNQIFYYFFLLLFLNFKFLKKFISQIKFYIKSCDLKLTLGVSSWPRSHLERIFLFLQIMIN